jgi:hypothetical protein
MRSNSLKEKDPSNRRGLNILNKPVDRFEAVGSRNLQ